MHLCCIIDTKTRWHKHREKTSVSQSQNKNFTYRDTRWDGYEQMVRKIEIRRQLFRTTACVQHDYIHIKPPNQISLMSQGFCKHLWDYMESKKGHVTQDWIISAMPCLFCCVILCVFKPDSLTQHEWATKRWKNFHFKLNRCVENICHWWRWDGVKQMSEEFSSSFVCHCHTSSVSS